MSVCVSVCVCVFGIENVGELVCMYVHVCECVCECECECVFGIEGGDGEDYYFV